MSGPQKDCIDVAMNPGSYKTGKGGALYARNTRHTTAPSSAHTQPYNPEVSLSTTGVVLESEAGQFYLFTSSHGLYLPGVTSFNISGNPGLSVNYRRRPFVYIYDASGDQALVRVTLTEVYRMGTEPDGSITKVTEEEDVDKFLGKEVVVKGAKTTQGSRGRVVATRVSETFGQLAIHNLVKIRSLTPQPVSQRGDSGALVELPPVVNANRTVTKEAFGFIIAGDGNDSYALPLRPAIRELEREIYSPLRVVQTECLSLNAVTSLPPGVSVLSKSLDLATAVRFRGRKRVRHVSENNAVIARETANEVPPTITDENIPFPIEETCAVSSTYMSLEEEGSGGEVVMKTTTTLRSLSEDSGLASLEHHSEQYNEIIPVKCADKERPKDIFVAKKTMIMKNTEATQMKKTEAIQKDNLGENTEQQPAGEKELSEVPGTDHMVINNSDPAGCDVE